MRKRKFVKYRSNRKLHEEGSEVSYISMSKLADIVVGGDDVSVIDDGTGEDLTVQTLARVLYDLCRGGTAKTGVKSVLVLEALKKSISETMKKAA